MCNLIVNGAETIQFWIVGAAGVVAMIAALLSGRKPGGSEDSENPSPSNDDQSGWGV